MPFPRVTPTAVLCLFAVLLLSACETAPSGQTDATGASTEQTDQSVSGSTSDQPESAVVKPAPGVATGSPDEHGKESRTEEALLPPPVPEIEPESLMGLEGAELTGQLGEPFMIREETPAEVWQYRSESCVFDLFLYPEQRTRRVIYMEARDKSASKVPEKACLTDILESLQSAPTG